MEQRFKICQFLKMLNIKISYFVQSKDFEILLRKFVIKGEITKPYVAIHL